MTKTTRRTGVAALALLAAAWAAALLTAAPVAHAQIATLTSLLAEMTDPDAVARFPAPRLESLQASSFTRASTNRHQPNQD